MKKTRYTSDMLGLRESTLHRDLKSYYAYLHGGLIEQNLFGYRIDVLVGSKAYEVQTKNFHKLRPKIESLLEGGYGVQIIYPIQGILESKTALGNYRKRRKKVSFVKAFDELVYVAKLLPRDGLGVEILILHERATKHKSRRNRVRNTRLVAILDHKEIQSPVDLMRLIPRGLESPFTTKDLMQHSGIGKLLAGKVAYTLHHSGLTEKVGSRDRYTLYDFRDGLDSNPGEELGNSGVPGPEPE
jgi:hypothetical protein